MRESAPAQPPSDKPTAPERESRLVWAAVAAAIVALLLVCVALTIVAAQRSP